jgi:PII-like signaling protein
MLQAPFFLPQTEPFESTTMPQRKHTVTPSELGMIRIYLKPSEKRKQPGLRGLLGARPFYRELVDAAKKDGIMNAVAHHTHYGYSQHGKVRSQDPESVNPDLTMCVEIIGSREQLELFCRNHGEILADKVIVYKHIEHWDVRGHDVEIQDGSVEELKEEGPGET